MAIFRFLRNSLIYKHDTVTRGAIESRFHCAVTGMRRVGVRVSMRCVCVRSDHRSASSPMPRSASIGAAVCRYPDCQWFEWRWSATSFIFLILLAEPLHPQFPCSAMARATVTVILTGQEGAFSRETSTSMESGIRPRMSFKARAEVGVKS